MGNACMRTQRERGREREGGVVGEGEGERERAREDHTQTGTGTADPSLGVVGRITSPQAAPLPPPPPPLAASRRNFEMVRPQSTIRCCAASRDACSHQRSQWRAVFISFSFGESAMLRPHLDPSRSDLTASSLLEGSHGRLQRRASNSELRE